MSSTVTANSSSAVSQKPVFSSISKVFKKNDFNETIKEILVTKINIENIKKEIEHLRTENWSNFQIAHYYVSLNDPDNPQRDKVKKGPNLGKLANKIIDKGRQAYKLKDFLEQPIKGICSIALTYNPSITSKKELYMPIMRTLLYGANRDFAQEVALLERNPAEISKVAFKFIPRLEKKVSHDLLELGAVGLASMIPVLGGQIRREYVQDCKKQRTLVDIRNMVDLIDDYEGIASTPNLESIKKETISSKMFNHLSVDGTGWYNNRHIHFFLTLSVPLFPPMLLLLVIGLWLNQTRSQGWLWHTDKRLVITNLIFLLPMGLYGVAKGGLFSYGPKWYDNRAYLIVLLLFLLPPVITSPVALYALVRSKAMGLTGKIITLLLFGGYVSLFFLVPPPPTT